MRKVISWDKYYMKIASVVSERSKDPNTQVGAVLVSKDNHIIGTGYNGFPPGCDESPELWESPTKYDYVIHSEMNTIIHSLGDTKGSTLYTTLFPCNDCAKAIIAAGISEVFYLSGDDRFPKTKELFNNSKISFVKIDID